ncbi:MAG: hypothetical protein HYS70_06485, partial [Nitrospinae bacterium]|nr:hypothetical protein [Nitrospinota bacterium]
MTKAKLNQQQEVPKRAGLTAGRRMGNKLGDREQGTGNRGQGPNNLYPKNGNSYAIQFLIAVVVAAVLLVSAVPAAHAGLKRVGPVNNVPSVGGYPAWYQDTTGLALEFCDPKNQAELDGGWCLLLPVDIPVVPEVFPTNFVDEHFWYAAEASMTTGNSGKALLVLAVEAAFAADVEPGGQISFSRIRVKLTDVPVPGTYRFIHPYGEELFTCPDECRGAAGDLIFFSDDVGIAPLIFTDALTSRLGPFLLPSNTPGGPELPATPGPAGLYIADPARSGPVTGSPLPNFIDSTGASRNHNIFRIEGPVGSNLDGNGHDFIETTDFALMGRVFQGAIAGEATVDHAVYARTAASQKVDVYATAFPATQGRLPAGLPPAVIVPVLAFFDAPCTATPDENGNPGPPFSAPVGFLPNLMSAAGSHYFGQSHPATLPLEVCIQMNALTAGGQPVEVFFPA